MTEELIVIIGFVPLIICVFAIVFYMNKVVKKPSEGNVFIIQSIPNTLITCGVLGTFIGIAIGLQFFNIEDISGSINKLLSGLKSAFWSSIVGITLSIIASNYIKIFLMKHGDKLVVPVSEETKAIMALQEEMKMQTEVTQQIQKVGFELLTESLGSFATTITESNSEGMQDLIGGLDEKVNEIVETMKENNGLMVDKFDEFSALLAKANVEALKLAFEQLITDFNKTFQELISSLVDQNFKELTDSVKYLNVWQVQNRKDVERLYVIIESLLNQSTVLINKVDSSSEEILNNLQTSSISLNSIVEKTNLLVNNDSELVKILNALKKVMVDDSRFIEMASNLNLASNSLSFTSKKLGVATVSLDETARGLKQINEWHEQLTNSTQTIIRALSMTQSSFDNIENKLERIVGHTGDLVNDDSRLVKIVTDLDTIANDENNNFKVMTDKLSQAVSEFEDEKRLITNWLNKESGIHSAMLLYTEGIRQFTTALEAFEQTKNYDLNVFNKTFERNLETSLLSTFNQLDRLLQEYVHFLETDEAKRIVQIEFTSKHK